MGQRDGEIMLVHQLLKEQDFKEKCLYCGKDFINQNAPCLSRHGNKEYITLSCSSGHTHSFAVDMTRAYDAKLIHKEIQNRNKGKVRSIEEVVILGETKKN